MKRPEAVDVLKEILINCNSFEGKSIKLMPPDDDSVISKGFQIHIQKTGNGEIACISRVAKKHGLQVHDDSDFLVIYKSLL